MNRSDGEAASPLEQKPSEGVSMYFIYLNTAAVCGGEITKIGIAKNPDKRVMQFNCGVKHRARGGYCPYVAFVRRMTLAVNNKEEAKKIEKKYKRINKNKLIGGFGSEVFGINLDDSYKILKGVINAVS